jgi:hypothetical protein
MQFLWAGIQSAGDGTFENQRHPSLFTDSLRHAPLLEYSRSALNNQPSEISSGTGRLRRLPQLHLQRSGLQQHAFVVAALMHGDAVLIGDRMFQRNIFSANPTTLDAFFRGIHGYTPAF